MLRTNLGKAARLRREIIETYSGKRPLSVAFWRDIPMRLQPDGSWSLALPITEPGYFKAKAYFIDALGQQVWPDGPDVGLCCHPNGYRTANTIYCAFTRMFGPGKAKRSTRDASLEAKMEELDRLGFTVIPASGTFRDLRRELPHIMETLGCKVIQLLPINPVPTTFARFGRFGSPYACQDLVAIDPALVEFDKRTTGVQQFQELARDIHARGGRLFLDVVINHTGWGSTLYENHPEWFVREPDGKFASPGAWGTIWEDLVELNPHYTELWEHLADAFLTWCRRGVDGFRCDAGYKVPLPVWQYIEARVRQEFPDTVFLLEGLGGSWEATETLLTDGGMQWAYSELFQNYSGGEVQWYLDYALRQSERVGVYVHYSETHDNDRLAKKGRQWSLLRNRLCALTSVTGGFAFTCGVEWLADEKLEVHQSRGLNWGAEENIVPELAALNRLISNHPCFFDGAKLTRLSANAAPVFALDRLSAEGRDRVLVLVNTDVNAGQEFSISETVFKEIGEPLLDLLGQPALVPERVHGRITFRLPPGGAYCLASSLEPVGLAGNDYRRARAQAAWAVSALSKVLMPEEIGQLPWLELARLVDDDPKRFLGAVSALSNGSNLPTQLQSEPSFPKVIDWTAIDRRRITPVPPGHWLLVQDSAPFRATLRIEGCEREEHVESIAVRNGHVAFFATPAAIRQSRRSHDATLLLERYGAGEPDLSGAIRFLAREPYFKDRIASNNQVGDDALVLLTNGIGGMARLCVDVGRIKSKYDCALGANLHPSLPVDRHVFVKRLRIWVNADGFITPLNLQNLDAFEVGPPAVWTFRANAGDERTVCIRMTADMLDGRNSTLFRFELLPQSCNDSGESLLRAPVEDVRLTVRVDIEDRNFHTETVRNSGAEHHFAVHTATMPDRAGFTFSPAHDRQLRVFSDHGFYYPQPEWCDHVPHPIEQSRGQVGEGAAFSPGWFDLPLHSGQLISLVLCADKTDPSAALIEESLALRVVSDRVAQQRAKLPDGDSFGRQLVRAARQFVVRRDHGKTVIAGYPWFLDWGRDTMIAARGLLSAGLLQDVTDLLLTYGRFVEGGTMPNTIHGDNASNRNTSDAQLWYGIVAEETAAYAGEGLYDLPVDSRGRTIRDVLREIATGYLRGTNNGIRVDHASALVWSPVHFTWMDTNHPAGTPREGYPVEIQVLWIRLLRLLDRLNVKPDTEPWGELAVRAEQSLHRYFWLEDRGYLSDLLIASAGQPASEAIVSDTLRSNYLLAVAFGFVKGEKAKRCVEAARKYLVVPGALRTLAPLPIYPPLPIYAHGRLVNNPVEPYAGQYAGDEDTQRKPAYHNGTAWTWPFPIFCEALACAWDFSPEAVATAKAYLGSMDRLMQEVCVGQLPEIVDGDAPHLQRGCDAQAWGVTEALRVWKLLNDLQH